MDTVFDYLTDVLKHRAEVAMYIERVCGILKERATVHDLTKLSDPEFSIFVSTRERFKKVNYGTKEYEALTEEAKEAVDHHYRHNRHHTAYHKNGINDMNLIDLIEMVCDWLSAQNRSPDKTIWDTLDYAQRKYKIDKQLLSIMANTLRLLENRFIQTREDK